jgi:hypothetical protein
VARLKAPPRAYGWCRTRGRGATLALTWQAKRGLTVSAETMRRWVHAVGWVWKRAKLVATDDDPQRVDRLARSRLVCEPLKRSEALVWAEERAIHRWPTVGSAWRPTGTPVEVLTPGQHATPDWAGALDPTPGTRHEALGPRNTHARFRELLTVREARSPADW